MGTYLATLLVGGVIGVAQGSAPVIAQSGGVYSTQAAVNTMPFSGVQCHLQSYMDQGRVVTVQVCK